MIQEVSSMSVFDTFTASHAVIQRNGDGQDPGTVVCLTGHRHDAECLAEQLSDLGDGSLYEAVPIAPGRQLLEPDPLTAEERAVLAVMDLLGGNSFTLGFIYRFEMPAETMLETLKRHLAYAATRQPALTGSEILNRHLDRLVTVKGLVVSPFSTRFVGILKRRGKREKNRFQLLDPDDTSNLYARFQACDVRSFEEGEAGLTITLARAA
jgi:phage FluMu protein gp41